MVQAYSGIMKRAEYRGSHEVLTADFSSGLLLVIAWPGRPRKQIDVLDMAL